HQSRECVAVRASARLGTEIRREKYRQPSRCEPPRSGVVCFSRNEARTAALMAAASSAQPKWSSIMDAARIAARGLAIFFPAYFGAEPCTGSNSDTLSGLMLPEGANPIPPAN